MTVLDPGLPRSVFAGTSAGATKAWESRKRAEPATPAPAKPAKVRLDDLPSVEKAFTLHGTKYDTRVTEVTDVDTSRADDGTAIAVSLEILDKQGEPIGQATRSVAVVDGDIEVSHEHMELTYAEDRGKGIGTEFLRDSVAMYEQAGVDHVKTMAASSESGDSNGAYTWARLGFQLDKGEAAGLAERMKAIVSAPYEDISDPERKQLDALRQRVEKGAPIQEVALDPIGSQLLQGRFGNIYWHGTLPVRKPKALAASADTGDVDYDDWAAIEAGEDPYAGLTAVGTSEGAKRAWESRKKADPAAPTLTSKADAEKAFTFTDPKYSTKVTASGSADAMVVASAIYDPDGNKVGNSTRMVSQGGKRVNHTSLYLDAAAQGKGIGSEYLRDSIEMYKRAGVEKITVTASSSLSEGLNGGYTWAKLGFRLDQRSRWKVAQKMRGVADSAGQKWLGQTVRDSFTKLADRVESGDAEITDVMEHTIGKNFLLGKYGDLSWHGYINVNDPALVAAAALVLDYEAWADIEQGLDPYDTLTADAGDVELVDDETDRVAQAAYRAAYRAAIELVAPRVLARIESERATNRALTAAGDENDQIITDAEWSAIGEEHVDEAIGDGVLDGVVAGASQFLKLATQSSVAKAFAAAASGFAGFASELRSKIDTWIGNKIGQGITGDWGIGRVIAELGLDSPLSDDKADLVAATETQAAVNAGTFAALQVATPAAIRWVTERDEKVRPTHVAADRDTVPFGTLFTVGGHEARFPGDPNLPARERFNCRCHLAYVEGTEARRVVGATKAELRAKAAALSISGRSTMNKGQLQAAVLKDLCLQGLAGGPDCPDVLDQMNRTALLATARGEGIIGRYRMSREDLVYQLRQSLRGGNDALVAKGYSTTAELARAKKKAAYKLGRATPSEFATSTVPSPAARRSSRQALFEEFGGVSHGSVPCVHCGLRLAADPAAGLAVLVPEPIIPWSQGGSLSLKNLVPACPGCFRARGGTGLVSAGTSEGAKKAWESRARSGLESLLWLDEGTIPDAFTMKGDKYEARVGNVENAYGAVEVTVYLYDPSGKAIGVANRQVTDDGSEVHHDVLIINEDAQGKGVGAEYLRDSVKMYQEHGVKYVTVDATSDDKYGNGAYTWARLGFTPKPKEVDAIAQRYKEAAGQHQKPPLDDDALMARIGFADDFRRGTVTIQQLSQDPIGKKLLLGDYGDISWEGYIDVAKGLAAAAGPVDTDSIDYDEWAAAEAEMAATESFDDSMVAAGTHAGAEKAWDTRGRGDEELTAEEFGKRVPSKRDSAPAEWFGSPAEVAATRALIAQKVAANPRPTRAQIAKNRRMLKRAETHGRAGGELRGNSTTRRLRGEALFREFGGDRKGYCCCGYCGLKVSPRGRGGYASMQQDKILTAAEGGKYGTPTSFPNLLPACSGCNASRNDETYRLPMAAAADIGQTSNRPMFDDGAEVVAFPLGWDDPDIDTIGRPVQGVLEHRTVDVDGDGSYVQWLVGGEVIDPDTIMGVNPDGTLTAVGTSEGATKAWESRNRVLSPAEADAWAAGSALPNTLYHGTRSEAADAIEAHGFDLDAARAQHGNMLRGVYLTESLDVARQYAAQNGGRVVAARAKVDKVATFDDVMEVAHTLPKDLPLADFEAQLTTGLTAKGYDAARFLNDEVTVFDPHEIAVFDPNKLRAIDPGLVAAGTSAGAKKAWESRQRAKPTTAALSSYTVDPAVPPRTICPPNEHCSHGFPALSEFYYETLAAEGAGFTAPAVAPLKERMATDPVAVRMTAKGINGLVKDGRFKTIAETRSSRGTGRYADYKQARQTYESFRLGVDLQEPSKTPVYGYLERNDTPGWAIDSYGDFEVRLKDHVKNRATATEGDSLDGLRPVAFGEAATASDADWWLAHHAGAREMALAHSKPPHTVPLNPDEKAIGTYKHTYAPIYTEVQIYGGVSLDDVSEVIVHKGAPLSKATRAGLMKAGVKITVLDEKPEPKA